MFLPQTAQELKKLGWDELDVIIVSGDAYIDSPYSGTALIGKSLVAAGYRVGVISQPKPDTADDIMRLGSPRLFWGVTAGTTDSMVANYTASGKKRMSCDFTPGGKNTLRPDRASIAYTNLIKRFDTAKRPVVLGGIEASLRRLSHYDFMTDSIRRPIIFDAKADLIIYGMGEHTVVEIADRISGGKEYQSVKGIVYSAKEPPEAALILPSYDDVKNDKKTFNRFFSTFYDNSSSLTNNVLAQKTGDRWAVQNPPYIMSSAELDKIHDIDFELDVHPFDQAKGKVGALETARFSIQSHRGCYGECSFCAISVHQGRRVVSRSERSVLEEAKKIAAHPKFTGIISDVGGATANMYGSECPAMANGKPCPTRKCLRPEICKNLDGSHKRYINLLKAVGKTNGVKKVLISSGIRFDLAVGDKISGLSFIRELAANHTGGQIKLAPEHSSQDVLNLMGKPGMGPFERFAQIFTEASKAAGKKQFITCYLMAAHPGCEMRHMKELKSYIKSHYTFRPEQIQIFTPTPSTWSTCMYYTELAQDGRTPVVSAKSQKDKTTQKNILSDN